jgi:hypothetical protein
VKKTVIYITLLLFILTSGAAAEINMKGRSGVGISVDLEHMIAKTWLTDSINYNWSLYSSNLQLHLPISVEYAFMKRANGRLRHLIWGGYRFDFGEKREFWFSAEPGPKYWAGLKSEYILLKHLSFDFSYGLVNENEENKFIPRIGVIYYF